MNANTTLGFLMGLGTGVAVGVMYGPDGLWEHRRRLGDPGDADPVRGPNALYRKRGTLEGGPRIVG